MIWRARGIGRSLVAAAAFLAVDATSSVARADDVAPATDVAPTADFAPSTPPAFVTEPPVAPTVMPPTAPSVRRVRLPWNPAVDLTVSGVLVASLVAWQAAIKPALPVPSCTICDRSDGRVNALDDAFRSAFKLSSGAASTAGTVSDVFGYGVGPLAGVALGILAPRHDGRIDEAPENLLLITEATLTWAVLQQSLTVVLPRERPIVHAEAPADRESSLQRHSALESFPGGHNGLGFAVAAAGGTVATMRHYRLAPLVWIVGGGIALVTSYLRLAADKHYFTDLSAGATLGIGVGVAVPLLFHRPDGDRPSPLARWLSGARISTTEVPGGRIVGVGWTL